MSALPHKPAVAAPGRLNRWLRPVKWVLLPVLAGVVLWILWPRIFPPQPAIRTSVLVEEIRAAAKLATVEMHATVVTNRDDSTWYGSKFLFLVVPGRAAVGFDLEAVGEGSVAVNGEAVTIRLPAPQVLYVDVDLDSVEVYNAVGLLRPQFTPEENRALLSTAREKIRLKAEQESVKRRAEEQAKELITRLATAAGAKAVTVEIAR